MIAASDLAITQGCGENCPYVPGAHYRDWPLDDPKGQDETTVRRIITDIDTRVRNTIHELVPDHNHTPSLLPRETTQAAWQLGRPAWGRPERKSVVSGKSRQVRV